MVLSGSPATYVDAVNRAVDIEESLLEAEAPVQPTSGFAFQPVQSMSQSFQSPQGSQQSNRQQFRPRGKQFKKKANSSSSGSVSSGSSGSGSMSCGQCGGKHPNSQCRGSTRRFDGYRPSANTQSPSLAQGELLALTNAHQPQLLSVVFRFGLYVPAADLYQQLIIPSAD
ncbi:hypothetical protein F511_38262 [Dorcoceras hygrometricum]|uniref:Uncharacterized protein n=1 Tax=Dorcoceras hygrometricum TaxID=472368 RepID=A0A2Z7D6V7_9LAMI|nr:hypothetical protein F511_38262 [Dorcoceras hygrometricum]